MAILSARSQLILMFCRERRFPSIATPSSLKDGISSPRAYANQSRKPRLPWAYSRRHEETCGNRASLAIKHFRRHWDWVLPDSGTHRNLFRARSPVLGSPVPDPGRLTGKQEVIDHEKKRASISHLRLVGFVGGLV